MQVAGEMFVPCVGTDESPVACIWQVFRSELTMFVLHITTLIFGIIKASLLQAYRPSGTLSLDIGLTIQLLSNTVLNITFCVYLRPLGVCRRLGFADELFYPILVVGDRGMTAYQMYTRGSASKPDTKISRPSLP